MIEREVEIINKLGLHARAAARLVKVSSNFYSEIKITRNDRTINAKSIMGVMMLAAGKGSIITLIADGVDECSAIEELTVLIKNRFGESE